MKNTEIKNIFFRNNGASALYCGSALIWKKESGEIDPDNYIPKFNFSGKFTDDSTEEDWWYYANGNTSNKISLADKVNPETKIFDYEIQDKNLYRYVFYKNNKLERIYNLPDININNQINNLVASCENVKSIKIDGLNLQGSDVIANLFWDLENLQEVKFTNCSINTYSSFWSILLKCPNVKFADFTNLNLNDITQFNSIINNCSNLETIVITNLNLDNVTYYNSYFFDDYNSAKIKNIIGPIYNLKLSLNLRYTPLLTNDSAMVLINGLSEDIDGTKTITFSSSTYDTLTEEQIALATSKGWSVVRS